MGLLDSILGAMAGKTDSSGGAGDCKVWRTNSRKAAKVARFLPGSGWEKTNQFPPTKFKKCWALSK
jgi:hypothetical protein